MMKRLLSICVLTAMTAGCRGGAGLPPAGDPAAPAQVAGGKVSMRAMPLGTSGSSNTVTADMPVSRPDTKPCTVTLFKHFAFKDFTNKPFSYTPPAACPGPWAKVVLTFDVSTSKGVQFDRTGIIWVGGAVVYFGTTAEPSPTLAPYWSVERDVTDLSAIFTSPSRGQIALGNCYCPPNYTGILYGKAVLQFYPPDAKYPAPRVPDEVIGMPYSPPLGGATQIPQSAMTIATTLPRNVVSAKLDLYLQSQHDEEQWFMCVPDEIWNHSKHALGFCKGTAFREGEVSVDGMPAGIAPIYPWIYTGGLDPYLWFPIPGVQTLAFVPYRVDLTPFAGVLSNGSKQTVSVTVANAYDYFTGAGDLLLYRDPIVKAVTGKLVSDSLVAIPVTRVHNGIAYGTSTGLFGGASASGTLDVKSSRDFTITGYVDTSSGRYTTTVTGTSGFVNEQTYVYDASHYWQNVTQDTKVSTKSVTTVGNTHLVDSESYEFPLTVRYPISQTKKGFQLPIAILQGYTLQAVSNGVTSTTSNTVQAQGTMIFDQKFNWINVANDASSQTFKYNDSNGACYGRALVSKANVLTSSTNPGCK